MQSRITKGRQRGVVLVLVLWILALLTVMALTLRANQQTEVALSIGHIQQGQGRALALAAVHYAIARLLADREAEGRGGPEPDWLPDGRPNIWRFQGQEITIRVSAERGRINLNVADAGLLGRLMEVAGIPAGEIPALVGAILDWRDTNHTPQTPGAEDGDYRLAGKPYGAKDERFSSISELRLLPGMTPAYYQALAPALTVYSMRSSVAADLAPPLVLEALGMAADTPGAGNLRGKPAGFHRLGVVIRFSADDLYSADAIVDFNRAYAGGYRIVRWFFNRPVKAAVQATPG